MSNPWVHEFVKASLAYWPQYPHVLEVGSRNVNGSPRDVLTYITIASYTGVDIIAGEGVDYIADAANLDQCKFLCDKYDVVISTEMLEHVKDWRAALFGMVSKLRVEGLLVLTTRSPGFEYHPWPEDNWRFDLFDIGRIFVRHWKDLLVDTDPDPYQRRFAPNAPYFGVGIVAEWIGPLTDFAQHLNTLEVHTAR